ncbi:hypothetical protein WJX81_002104 [Elliptochloris bilobata]|uniref:Uncharacterized protein n=1 Tax=Elliptochloris bilobata TaxID=381761 RepID=A0AAW1R0X9_9CHLO
MAKPVVPGKEEVAISQLAVLENFTEHGLYVKFDDGEAAALEEQALVHALRESAAAADEGLQAGNGGRKASRNSARKEDARRSGAAADDAACVAAAEEASQQQSEWDALLRPARELRCDLEAQLLRCHARATEAARAAEAAQACSQWGRSGSAAAAAAAAEAAAIRAEAVEEGALEMGALEAYIQAQHPPAAQAKELTEEVMRQLLACLVHVGLSFPERSAGARATPGAPDLVQLVDCFRAGEPLPSATRGHSRWPSGGSSVGPSGGSTGAPSRWWGAPSPPRTPPPTPPPPGAHGAAGGHSEDSESMSGPAAAAQQGAPEVAAQGEARKTPRRGVSSSVKADPGMDAGEGRPGRIGGRLAARIRARRMSSTKQSARGPKRNPQVVSLFTELRELLPAIVMDLDFAEAPAAPTPRADRDAISITPQELEVAKAHANRHRKLVQALAAETAALQPASAGELLEFVRDADTRLAVVVADEAAVIAQFPSFPKARFDAMREAAAVYGELMELARREKQWLLQRGTCKEEAARLEVFLDAVRARVAAHAAKQDALQRKCAAHGLPWEPRLFSAVTSNAMHLATLYMSRILFEVASLERSSVIQHEPCLRLLAGATRVAHKVHQFAGGFTPECSDLFDKVRRLSRYYLRLVDPAWLREGTNMHGLL